IAFVSRVRGTFQIFIMNQDGSGIQQLTSPPGNNEDPTWAADGRRLCFTSDRTGKPQIFVMLDDGTGVTQLTFEGRNQSSSWSPFME
ncbi:MAG TPA: protein TolB, partial [Candidatus Sumerlaeota bacterium]|nr:protein TolB [Candidatus Sumerlaeota bacterium]